MSAYKIAYALQREAARIESTHLARFRHLSAPVCRAIGQRRELARLLLKVHELERLARTGLKVLR